MREKISAIIIDKDYKYRDYSEIGFGNGWDNEERRFQLRILDSGKDIFREIHRFNGVDAIITVGSRFDWIYLSRLPFEYRKRWRHIDNFNAADISVGIINVFLGNIERTDTPTKFSFFTSTYKTGKEKIIRLYNSMVLQTYGEWDWFVLDDSPDSSTLELIESFEDPRITVFKNVSRHGNIGFNKHMIAMACDGDYLIEVDHDDELTPDCLEVLLKAIEAFPNSDFLYSNCVELKGPQMVPIIYGKGWGWGEGLTKTEVVKGKEITFSESPEINPYSIRTIYSQPNHLRCWKKDFYHRIGGHNPEMSVLDDQELIIRTFLHGEMTKVDKVLYIQYESEAERGKNEDNTQSVRFPEIQRTTFLLKHRFDKDIHDRILSLGHKDTAWNEEKGVSILWEDHEPGQEIMSNYYKP